MSGSSEGSLFWNMGCGRSPLVPALASMTMKKPKPIGRV
jgi:hypothetical protein